MLQALCCMLLLCRCSTLASDCPTWFVDGKSTECECGAAIHGAIQCDNTTKQVRARVGWCVTTDHHSLNSSSVVAGLCPCLSSSYNTSKRGSFHVPSEPTRLNNVQCGRYHRKGLLCCQCIDGYGPSLYSLDFHCSNCSDVGLPAAIIIYTLLELIPIVLLFLGLWLFQVNTLSGPMLGYIVFCQSFVTVVRNDRELHDSILSFLPSQLVTLTKVSLTLSAMWNLLFFRFVVPPFCISSKLTGIHVSTVRLATAFIPLVLIAVVYVGLEANLQSIRGLRYIYKLLHRACCRRNRNNVNTGHSMIHVFAIFILMAISLVTYEVHSLVLTFDVYKVNGEVVQTVVYADSNIERFSTTHYPYFFTALFVMLLLVVCPAVILTLYPTPLYAYLVHFISPRKQIGIKIFAETFQASFKDGLNGTRDYRMLPGLGILSCAVYIVAESVRRQSPIVEGYIALGFVYITASLVTSCAQPCKTSIANDSLCFHFTLFGVWTILLGMWIQDMALGTEALALALVLLPLTPHLFLSLWLLYKASVYLLHRCYRIGG